MFTNISWSSYGVAIGALAFVWYLFLGFKFYYAELKQFVSGRGSGAKTALWDIKVKEPYIFTDDKSSVKSSLDGAFSESLSTLEDAEKLTEILVNAIRESIERKKSKEELQNYLQMILCDFPLVKESSFRETVNELMVSECEKHPQMILTYAEVDGLWDEAI